MQRPPPSLTPEQRPGREQSPLIVFKVRAAAVFIRAGMWLGLERYWKRAFEVWELLGVLWAVVGFPFPPHLLQETVKASDNFPTER